MSEFTNFSLEGKVALVTGASYGIGFAIASAYAEAGATICFNDINQDLVDKGLDTGDILCQREIVFDEEKETFASSYDRLLAEIQELFRENWEDIREGRIAPRPQEGSGSAHRMREIASIREQMPFTWYERIADFKRRFRELEQ